VAKFPYGAELTFVHLFGVPPVAGFLRGSCGVILRVQSSQGLTPQKTPQNKASRCKRDVSTGKNVEIAVVGAVD